MEFDLRLYAPWRDAVRRAYDTGNSRSLITLLRSEIEMPQIVRYMLAALLERRDLKKKRGAQRTPLFKTSAKGRLELATRDVRRVQHGELILLSDWMKYMPRELSERARRGEPLPIKEVMQSVARAMSENPPQRMTRGEAINKVAEFYGKTGAVEAVDEIGVARVDPGIDAQTLANYIDNKIGFGGKNRRPRSKAK